MLNRTFPILLVTGLVFGALLTWIDTRPTWDDTGVTAGMIFIASALLGAAMPSRAWAFALAVGLWIPLVTVARNGNVASLLALLVAFAGAYVGAFGRRMLGATAG